jgi:predicted outer membrane repeat protein
MHTSFKLLFFLIFIHVATPLFAANYNVNFGLDLTGLASLRQAILDANANPGPDTITFTTPMTYILTSGELPTITGDTTITSAGHTVIVLRPSGPDFRLLSVAHGAYVTLHGMTFQGGRTTGEGGAIWNNGNLILDHMVITGNRGDYGGGIYNRNQGGQTGTLLVRYSTISSNSAINGGGILSEGPCTIHSSTLSGNAAIAGPGGGGVGGGILSNTTAPVAVVSSTFSGNTAGDRGGAVSGPLDVHSSTFTGNTAGNSGGGIDTPSPLTLTNTLVLGNTAPVSPEIAGPVTATASLTAIPVGLTIGDILFSLGNNGGPTQTHALPITSPALDAGLVTSLPADTHDLDGDTNTTEPIPFDQRGAGFPRQFQSLDIGAIEYTDTVTITAVDAAAAEGPSDTATFMFTRQRSIGSLTVNYVADGASTATPSDYTLSGSAGQVTFADGASTATVILTAINEPNNFLESSETVQLTLTAGPGYQPGGSSAATATIAANGYHVFSTADSGPGSLRQAFADAAAQGGASNITLDPALSGQTITLASEIALTDAEGVTLDATALPAGLTISGGGINRIFRISNGANVTLRALTLTGGNINYPDYGGAIYNIYSTLTLERCTFMSNTASATLGGAIHNFGNGNHPVTITRCTFTGNSAIYGGAISCDGGPMQLNHCTIAGNSAITVAGTGGGIYNINGSIHMNNSIVANNTAPFFPDLSTVSDPLIGGGNYLVSNPTLLWPLGQHGGPTPTMPLRLGSAARDAATASASTTDQRGLPMFGQPDIGAYEDQFGAIADIGYTAESSLPSTIPIPLPFGNVGPLSITSSNPAFVPNTSTALALSGAAGNYTLTLTPIAGATGVTTITLTDTFSGFSEDFRLVILPIRVTHTGNSGLGSLREIIANAEALPGPTTIILDPVLAGQTITLANQIELADVAGVTIDATTLPGGLTISGGGSTRIFRLLVGARATLCGLSMRNGRGNLLEGFDFGSGGAISCLANSSLTLSQCAFFMNSTHSLMDGVGGGAIFAKNSNLHLNHCTFTNNSATNANGEGGAIYADNCRLILIHCTLSGNSAIYGGAIYTLGYFTYGVDGVTLNNSIVAGNTAEAGADIYNIDAIYTNNSNAGNTSNILLSIHGVGELNNMIYSLPLLAPLGDYGGPTPTMPLLANSPARNASNNSTATTDQRGYPMISTPDIGAYEAGNMLQNYAAWALETFPGGTPVPDQAQTADIDGDGTTNLMEFYAQTNPLNAQSAFATTLTTPTTSTLRLSFPTIPQRRYRLQESTDLGVTPFANTAEPALTGDGTVKFFDAPIVGSRNFYRIQIENIATP